LGDTEPNPEIFQGIEQALMAFVRNDLDLLHPDANERNISQRLALHLQAQFPDYKVDCEYNRDADHIKRLDLYPENARTDDLQGKTIYPDIVVHRRDEGSNLLVIEVGKKAGEEDRKKDLLKLRRTKEEYRYEGALFINFGSREKPIEDIEWV
jgi:hypothetical protein